MRSGPDRAAGDREPVGAAPASANLGTSAASPTPGVVADPALVAALTYLSDDAPQVAFTNWATVLAGQAPGSASDVVKLLTSLNRTRAIPASLLLPRIAMLRETWGFDVFDLAWEADFSGCSPAAVRQRGDGSGQAARSAQPPLLRLPYAPAARGESASRGPARRRRLEGRPRSVQASCVARSLRAGARTDGRAAPASSHRCCPAPSAWRSSGMRIGSSSSRMAAAKLL